MKIKCSFCDAVIDTTQELICPNCGAQISNNEQFQEYQMYKQQFDEEMRQLEFKEQQENVKRKTLENEQIKRSLNKNKSSNTLKMILGIILAPIIGFVVLFIITMIFALNYEPKDSNTNSTIETTEPYVQEFYDLKINETAHLQYSDCTISEWGYYTPASYAIRKGEKYIKVKFTITNTVDEKIYREYDVRCYDSNGAACQHQASLVPEDKNTVMKKQTILPGQSYTSYCYFIVPQNETQITVNYGDYVKYTIDINKEASNEVN